MCTLTSQVIFGESCLPEDPSEMIFYRSFCHSVVASCYCTAWATAADGDSGIVIAPIPFMFDERLCAVSEPCSRWQTPR